MDKEVLKQLLKENLCISIEEEYGVDSKCVEVKIEFDGELIAKDWIYVGIE